MDENNQNDLAINQLARNIYFNLNHLCNLFVFSSARKLNVTQSNSLQLSDLSISFLSFVFFKYIDQFIILSNKIKLITMA